MRSFSSSGMCTNAALKRWPPAASFWRCATVKEHTYTDPTRRAWRHPRSKSLLYSDEWHMDFEILFHSFRDALACQYAYLILSRVTSWLHHSRRATRFMNAPCADGTSDWTEEGFHDGYLQYRLKYCWIRFWNSDWTIWLHIAKSNLLFSPSYYEGYIETDTKKLTGSSRFQIEKKGCRLRCGMTLSFFIEIWNWSISKL